MSMPFSLILAALTLHVLLPLVAYIRMRRRSLLPPHGAVRLYPVGLAGLALAIWAGAGLALASALVLLAAAYGLSRPMLPPQGHKRFCGLGAGLWLAALLAAWAYPPLAN